MYAGKTSSLMKEALTHNAVIFKPKYDTRYSEDEIVTHDGECLPAYTFSSMKDIAIVGETQRPYCFDEIQFLDGDRYDGNFVDDIKMLLTCGVDIMAAGLDMDWKGNPFKVTASLLAMADHVTKLTASCSVCNSDARKTYKSIKNDSLVELGASDLYEARCNTHWVL